MVAVFWLVLLNMLPEPAHDLGDAEKDFLRRSQRAATCPIPARTPLTAMSFCFEARMPLLILSQ